MKKIRAFSLVELSVVIFIIGLLIAGVSQTSKMIDKSRLAAAQSQTKQSSVKDISGLVLWYETTLDKSFLPEEIVDGGAVSKWLDINPQALSKSDAAYSGAATNRPSYVSDAINDLPAISCNGSNSYLSVISGTPYNPGGLAPAVFNNFTIFVVASASAVHEIDIQSTSSTTGVSGQKYLLGALNQGGFAGGPTMVGSGISMGKNGVSVYEHTNGYMYPIAVYDGSSGGLLGRPAIITLDYNNKTPAIYINSNTSRIGLTSPMLNIVAPVMICYDGAYGYFNGYVGEIIVFNRHLLISERKAVENYLSRKWKINFS